MGLSTSHKLPRDFTESDINTQLQAAEEWASGPDPAELLAIWREMDEQDCRSERLDRLRQVVAAPELEKARIKFYDGGSLAQVKLDRLPREQQGGGPRDIVSTFSKNSRRRLMRKIAMLERSRMPVFVTLTYPAEYPDDWQVYKEHLRTFAKRYGRKFEGGAFIWRLEFQKRGAPHYHLLCYGAQYKELFEWVSLAWYEVVASGDEKHLRAGTKVERIRSWKHVMAYASKVVGRVMSGELAKEAQATAEGVGRWWGVYFRAKMPWAEVKDYILERAEAQRMLRYMRKFGSRWVFVQAKHVTDAILRRRLDRLISKGKLKPDDYVKVKRSVSWRAYEALTVFCDASFWRLKLPYLAVPDPPMRFRATGRPVGVPFREYMRFGG